MEQAGPTSDMGFGLAILFGAVALVGALVMYFAAADQVVAAGGFALALLAGSLSVAMLHRYDSR